MLISVMIELSTVCQLNMGNGIVRFLPDLGGRSARTLGAVYGLTVVAALLVGSAFVVVAPHLSHELALPGRRGRRSRSASSRLLVLWGVFTLQDAALMAMRRAPWDTDRERPVVLPQARGAARVPLGGAGALNGVFLAWVLPMALLLVPVILLVFGTAIPQHVAGGARESSIARIGPRRVVRFLAQDYLASIFTQATLTVLPLLVIAILGAQQSAYFAMPFTIAMAFDTFALQLRAPRWSWRPRWSARTCAPSPGSSSALYWCC